MSHEGSIEVTRCISGPLNGCYSAPNPKFSEGGERAIQMSQQPKSSRQGAVDLWLEVVSPQQINDSLLKESACSGKHEQAHRNNKGLENLKQIQILCVDSIRVSAVFLSDLSAYPAMTKTKQFRCRSQWFVCSSHALVSPDVMLRPVLLTK